MNKTLSVVVPVYRNEESLPELLDRMRALANRARVEHEVGFQGIFVVDGSPDGSYGLLAARLPDAGFRSRLLLHSRNFGAFAAVRTGLAAVDGDFIGVMAADLQEPSGLMLDFLARLIQGDCDVAVGVRSRRDDPLLGRLGSALFWWAYRTFVNRQVPEGGVDVFGCNQRFRAELLRLGESNSSLVGLLFWLGFRRCEVPYVRRARKHGRSAWSLRRKIDYLLDSVFSFTDLPIKVLSVVGLLGMGVSAALGMAVLTARLLGGIPVPGYAATMLTVIFFGGLNALGLGIVGSYAWRAYENTKARPLALVMAEHEFGGEGSSDSQRDAPGSEGDA